MIESRLSEADPNLPAYDNGDQCDTLPAYNEQASSLTPGSSGTYPKEKTKADTEYPDEKNNSEPYLDPIILNGHKSLWNCLLSSESLMSSDITTYVSQDSKQKYKIFKDAVIGTEKFENALDLQRKGFAMPILRTDHHTLSAMHSIRYMSVFKYTPPPANEDRLFDKNLDTFKFCEITKERCASYYKYEFQCTPDPADPSKNFSLWMYHHHRYPIADLTPYDGVRYRWVYERIWKHKISYKYTLNILHDDQVSLTDDLDLSTHRVSKTNPLLGSAWKNNILPLNKKKIEFYGKSIGLLEDRRRWWSAGSPAEFGIIQSDMEHGDKQEEFLLDSSNSESVHSLSDASLVFLCMSAVFKRIEDAKERARRASKSGSGSW